VVAEVARRPRGVAAEADPRALEFPAGRLIVKSPAVERIFVFVTSFGVFAVPHACRKRVLVIGVLGAIVVRCVLILAGSWLTAQCHRVQRGFGAFLLSTGLKLWWAAGREPDIARNPVLGLLRRFLPVARRLDAEKFWTVEGARRIATPALMVLAMTAASPT
jgi:tellurite resistance protein TerC